MVTQCSSRNFTENLPAWEFWAQTNPCAIFTALTTCVGAPAESTTFFQGFTCQLSANYICSAPEQMPRQTFVCLNAHTCLRREVGAQSVLVWLSLWQECPRAVPLGGRCQQSREQVCTRRSSLCVPTHRSAEEQVCCTFTHWFTAWELSLSGQELPPYLRYCVWAQTNPWPRIWKYDEAKAASSAGLILPQECYSEESWHFCTAASFCKGTA